MQLAGGFGLPGAGPLDARIEDSFRRQLEAMPDQTRRLLQLAAADPSGDASLVWRAAGRLGLDAAAAAPVGKAGLAESAHAGSCAGPWPASTRRTRRPGDRRP